ncbi:MAG: protease modulator HflC [Gammaproteobacteria bacterium]
MALQRLLIPLLALVVVGSFCVFTVDQREYAILFQFEKIKRSDFEPGMHVMLPFINQVRKFDKRLMSLDSLQPERFLTKEKKDVMVDSFVKWRIEDVETYYKRTRGDVRETGEKLFQQINNSLRDEFGKRTVQEVVARGDIIQIVTAAALEKGRELGVEVIDVRTKRINLPSEVSNAVYDRMRAERERVGREFRSRGEEAAERIRAKADRESTEISAEAYREAEQVRGEGDASAAKIYADTYKRNSEFYSFYRSLLGYRTSFGQGRDVLLIEPKSEFFNYFKDSTVR